MSIHNAIRGIGVAACVAIGISLFTATGALAATSVHLCVPEEAGSPVRSGGATGSCKAKSTPVALPSSAAEQSTLLSILSHAKYIESGVGGKPTIQFSGVNVQVVNGEGKTKTTNGEGNLVIGYDESEKGAVGTFGQYCLAGGGPQTGSHNLIVGEQQSFTSYGGIEAGRCQFLGGEFAAITGGWDNAATGPFSSVSGGEAGTTENEASSISGGYENRADSRWSWVGGGAENHANAWESSISGGWKNSIIEFGPSGEQAVHASISGGVGNVAEGNRSWIGGGYKNKVTQEYATIDGGERNTATGISSWVGGGGQNFAEGERSSVSGGEENKASGAYSSILGGNGNSASGEGTSVSGGEDNTALPNYSSILGGEDKLCASEYCHFP